MSSPLEKVPPLDKETLLKRYGKYMKQPYQRVLIGDVWVWKNRNIGECHIHLPPGNYASCLECPDGRCPEEGHLKDEMGLDTLFDWFALPLITELKIGMKVLVLIEAYEKSHVSIFTFGGFSPHTSWLQFGSIELSQKLYYFKLAKPNSINNDFPAQIDWHNLKYLAIVPDKEKLFGKFGGLGLFKRQLTRITGKKVSEISSAISELDALNPKPNRISLKPTGFLGDGYEKECFGPKPDLKGVFSTGPEKEVNFRTMLTNALSEGSRYANEAALLILSLTECGLLKKLCYDLADWQPPKIDILSAALAQAIKWYLGEAPTQGELAQGWWREWDERFHIGPYPATEQK